MIPYIDSLLNRWALWRAGANRGALGAKISSVYGLGAIGLAVDAAPDPNRFVPVDDVECYETDRAVAALPPELRRVVDEVYIYVAATSDEKMRNCGCGSSATFYRRLHEAHNHVMGSLNDLAAGVPVKPWRVTVDIVRNKN